METTATRERPILFSGDMVKAILSGAKTMTRRPMKPQPPEGWLPDSYGEVHLIRDGEFVMRKGNPVTIGWGPCGSDGEDAFVCPFGQPGDVLWVRETWKNHGYPLVFPSFTRYAADGGKGPWRPSIHMPRWAARIFLEVTGVRVERVQDISEADARAEGVNGEEALVCSQGCGHRDTEGDHLERWEDEHDWGFNCPRCSSKLWHHPLDECHSQAFRERWSAAYPGSWERGDWVWVISFKRIHTGEQR